MRNLLTLVAFASIAAAAYAADPKPATAQPGADKDKLICRREVPIGSLIASRKICLTKSEWDRRETDGNDIARKFVYDNASKQSGQ